MSLSLITVDGVNFLVMWYAEVSFNYDVTQYACETKESAKDVAGTVAEKGKEGAERTKQKTEEVAASTLNAGEKAKQSVQGAWDVAKDTTHKIKETLVGKDDDDNDGVLNNDVAELERRDGKSYDDKDDEEDTEKGANMPFFYVV
ncbi:uncharacterized protein LOC111242284 [Vigna radiata var. radiata]|uniref:Uncharacterized protein LOC111242284 n=1 Tax=Vigna radiata var. radiata TaxID=3916 RepID=A0A3Q0F9M4_VIGRR|nr:uncharacterized protein LOC111242284 [Vigna radiata var. radiata]